MSATDLRSKSVDELNEELVQLRKEQFNLRMQQATQELSQNHQHKRVRKDIARIKTILGEKQRASGDKA